MRKNDLNEIKGLDEKALNAKAVELRQKVSDLIIDKNMNKMKDLKSIAKLRKDLARVLTILHQKELIRKFEQASEGGTK